MEFEEIQRTLRVATQCGRCEDCARGIVELNARTQGAVAPAMRETRQPVRWPLSPRAA